MRMQVNTHKPAQTNLSTGWLGEPQSPFVHQRMLDIEIILVMKDSDLLIGSITIGLLVLVGGAVGGDRNSGEVDGGRWLVAIDGR